MSVYLQQANNFCTAAVDGRKVCVAWGAVRTKGTSEVKKFPTASEAQLFFTTFVAEKRTKNFVDAKAPPAGEMVWFHFHPLVGSRIRRSALV